MTALMPTIEVSSSESNLLAIISQPYSTNGSSNQHSTVCVREKEKNIILLYIHIQHIYRL